MSLLDDQRLFRHRLALILTGIGACLAARPVAAEYLYFTHGGMIQAQAQVDGDTVTIVTPSGDATFRREEFASILPGGCPEKEWAARVDAARKSDPPARFAAIWWALQNGLISEAVAALREFTALDPDYAPTARLSRTLDRLDRAPTDPSFERLRRALAVPCRELRGPHVLLLHQHDESDARARLDLLERVVVAYHLWLSGNGISVEVPSERLVSVYLAQREDYRAFLQSQNAGAFRSTLGYYHPAFKAVVCYDARWPSHTRTSPSPMAVAATNPRTHLLQELDALARDHGTAAHEMIHLLVSETALEPRPGAFPHWLHEGLAAQFEVVRGGRWAGISRVHDLRLNDLRTYQVALNPVDLVHDAGFGRGYRRDLYARSWAWVYFLRQTRPREFMAFLELLRVPEAACPLDRTTRVNLAFQAAFSRTPATLENEWGLFLDELETPLVAQSRPKLALPPASSP